MILRMIHPRNQRFPHPDLNGNGVKGNKNVIGKSLLEMLPAQNPSKQISKGLLNLNNPLNLR